MDTRISGRNIQINEALEDYTLQKVDRLDRYLPNIREVRVDLARQHNSRGENLSIAQITVKHERGAILRAEEKTTGEIRHAIDSAVGKMHRQIERFKGKRIKNKRRKGERFMATLEEIEMAESILDDIPDATYAVPDEEAPEVIRRKAVELLPMDEAEAIEQMELLGHSFFMFFNAETGKINVLYRRSDEGYGLLEPTD
jgi:putative sigma-54 modulation protein